ncbi:hypothetical protein DFJ74DRAFT_774798 [Hyaloraphidium curvatum]|nr:hypothetical protein DFJ74DRAFT_774798 [Hyaloraphidium curvatum]
MPLAAARSAQARVSRTVRNCHGVPRRLFGASAACSARYPGGAAPAKRGPPALFAGHATDDATRDYAAFFAGLPFHRVPLAALTVSRAGFGAHRVAGNPRETAALSLALRGGFNVVDTSSTFEQGRSEKAVGRVLKDLLDPAKPASLSRELLARPSDGAPKLQRAHIVLLSKAGPVPPSIAADLPPTIPTYSLQGNPASRHSIDPDFLSWSIDRSRKAMGVETIDCYGIDGLEQLFKGSGLFEQTVWDLFETAAAFLEDECAKGTRIRRWFLASTSIPAASLPNSDRTKDGSLSLHRVLEAVASAVRRRSPSSPPLGHLIGIQYPSNLFERQAYLPGGLGAQCRAAGLWQLANRPLNAITHSGKVRTLSDGPDAVQGWLSGDPDAPAAYAKRSEDALPALFSLLAAHEELLNAADASLALSWSSVVLKNLDALAGNFLACRAWVDRKLIPNVRETLDGHLIDPDEPPPGPGDRMPAEDLESMEPEEMDAQAVYAVARSYAYLLYSELPPALFAVARRNSALENAELAEELGKMVAPEKRMARRWGAQGWALEFGLGTEPGDPVLAGEGPSGEVEGGATTTLIGMRDPAYVRMAAEVLQVAADPGKRLGEREWKRIMDDCAALQA